MVTMYSRREIILRGASAGVAVLCAPVIAACQAVAPSPAGSAAGGSPSVGGSPATETTWERIKREGVVRLGFSNEPPFSIAEPEKLTGADPEIVRAVMAANGVETLLGVLTNFNGLIPGLQANRFDMIAAGMCMRPSRCEQVAFSEPHYFNGESFAVKKGNPLGLLSYEDILNNPAARFGVLQASVEEEYALKEYMIPQERVLSFPDVPATMSALQTGRVDAVAFTTLPIKANLANLNDPNLELATLTKQPVGKNGKSLVCHVAAGFRKEDSDFLAAYNQSLATLKANGGLLKAIEPFGYTAEELVPEGVTAAALCQP